MSLQPVLPQPVLRGEDLLVEIGHRHGYRIDGDHVLIHAELLVPPGRSDGAWSLELWAADRAYSDRARMEEPLTGVRVAQVALELPTPIGPHVHQVDTRTVARLPVHGRACAMVLALIEHRLDGGSSLRAFANYPELQLFSAPHFVGRVGYAVQGAEVVLEAEGISNPRASANLSGTLSLELWAFPEEAGLATAPEGVRLAWSELERIAGQSQITAIERRVAFTEPPEGRFGLSLILGEWTVAHGYVARDRRDFACTYEAGAKELPGSSAVGSPVPAAALPTPARPIDRLRLVPSAAHPASPAALAPAAAITAAAAAVGTRKPKLESPPPLSPSLISIQTGSLEELAGVKGLSLKLAKEIVKARPFSSVADLIRVRGIGDKTIARVKHLVTL